MTCARIAIVKTTWLLLETKITWQDRWLERERGHITNNVVRMITSCLTTAAGVNNLMSRYFQFIKFHVFWSSWDTLGNKTKLPPRQYFHLGPICFDWLWSVAWGKNWISQLDIAQQSKCESLGNWWLMTDHWSGVHNCLSSTGGTILNPATDQDQAPLPHHLSSMATMAHRCLAVVLRWLLAKRSVGGWLLSAGVSRLNLTCLCSLLPTILKQMDLPSVCFYGIITFCNNCKLFSLIIASELKKRTLESKHIHAAPDGSTWMTF